MQRQFPAILCPQIQFIDSGWMFLFRDGYPTVQTVQKTVEFSSGAALGPVLDIPVIVQRGAQFVFQGRRHLRRGADADSYGPLISEKHSDSSVAVH